MPERSLGGQITAVSGPLARSIADLRLGLAMAAPDPRDPWWAPAPLEAGAPKRVALCFYPDGLETEPAVVKALQDAPGAWARLAGASIRWTRSRR